MRIALLAAADNLHTIRWANGLATRDLDVHLVSAHSFSPDLDSRITQHKLPAPPGWGYYANAFSANRVFWKLQADVVNAHYCSGYGTLARLAGASPLLMSVWGSDVFDFPNRSKWCANLIRKNLAAATAICSISQKMAEQARRAGPSDADIHVVPWGVDTQKFSAPPSPLPDTGPITIGTVKTLAPKYGIDTLIEGFNLCRRSLMESRPELAKRLRLRLVGGGVQEQELKELTSSLGLKDIVHFVGPRPHGEVVDQLRKLDIYVAVSRLDSESFGVAIVEALACHRPVIVSEAGGLPEVVRDEETGLVVQREQPKALSDALKRLLLDDSLRNRLAAAGRLDVQARFEWSDNIAQMEAVYADIVGRSTARLAA